MSWGPETRLRSKADFQRVFAQGRSVADRALVLYWFSTVDGIPRAGFCVGKKLGKAVRRNRIKRLLREAWHNQAKSVSAPADLVFVARSGGVEFSLTQWSLSMQRLLERAGMIEPGGGTP